jgi:di/tricarboxylate transporter
LNLDQGIVFTVLGITLALFIWNRLRFDVVSMLAPVALSLATSLNVPTDAVLMAVAMGASSAFMTPIGHRSNALVMEPGGYQFGDYWRLGLPLSIIVTVVAVPMIMWVWA